MKFAWQVYAASNLKFSLDTLLLSSSIMVFIINSLNLSLTSSEKKVVAFFIAVITTLDTKFYTIKMCFRLLVIKTYPLFKISPVRVLMVG